MPRPTARLKASYDEIRDFMSRGITQDELCLIIGVGKMTFYRMLKRDSDLRDAVDDGRLLAARGNKTRRRRTRQITSAAVNNPPVRLGAARRRDSDFANLPPAEKILRALDGGECLLYRILSRCSIKPVDGFPLLREMEMDKLVETCQRGSFTVYFRHGEAPPQGASWYVTDGRVFRTADTAAVR